MDATKILLRSKLPADITVVEVAAAANVDPALVRYYFQNKKGLIRAAAVRIMDEIQTQSEVMLSEDGTLEERIKMRLRLLINVLKENPRFLQVVLNEIYQDDGAPGKKESLYVIADRGLSLSKALLSPRLGDPPIRNIDPRFLHVAMLGLCTFFVDAQPLLSVLFEDESESDSLTERYTAFASDLVLKGVVIG